MTRRWLLRSFGLAAASRLALPAPSDARQTLVDPEFLSRWNRVQLERPSAVGWSSRIAPPDEPGSPLVVHGSLFDRQGEHPIEAALVFAYQTDSDGRYDRPGHDGWRLRGWARTDPRGRFEFQTIRPGPYPGRDVAAHIHVGVDGAPGQRQTLLDVLFAGDPRLSAAERERSTREGAFANIRPVTIENGTAHVSIRFRLAGDFIF